MRGCIFRNINTNCESCKYNCFGNSNYCVLHNHMKNNAFTHIKHLEKDCYVDAFHILSVFVNLSLKKNKDTEIKRICKFLLGRRHRCFCIANEIFFNVKSNILKKDICSKIFERFNWYFTVFSLKSVNRKIRLVQSLWRNFRNVNINCINDEDPFSLNKLDDIKHVFYIREGDKKYGFEPIEFEYFLRNTGHWNPFTRQKINEEVIKGFYKFFKKHRLKRKNENNWMTDKQAYNDVAFEFDKFGIFVAIEWLLNFRIFKMVNAIEWFNEDMKYYGLDTFEIHFEDYENIHFAFAKCLISILKNNSDDNFFIAFYLYKNLMKVSHEFLDNAPSWISNDIVVIEFFSIQ